MRAFRCEWTKLWRLRQALAVWGVMAGIACLFGILFFANASETVTAPGPGRPASFLTLTDLAEAEGLYVTLRVAAQILLVVTFVLAAGSMAAEYTQGTLKVLLSRDPVRLRVLAGKTAALLAFAAVGIIIAALAQTLAVTAVASARGIAMDQWWTASNLADGGLLLLRVIASSWAWGILGMMLAILLRSAPAAIGLGIGYTILVEGILGLVLKDIHPYFPGQTLQSFVSAGQPAIGQSGSATPLGLEASAILGAIYALVFAAVAGAVFVRRDVTS